MKTTKLLAICTMATLLTACGEQSESDVSSTTDAETLSVEPEVEVTPEPTLYTTWNLIDIEMTTDDPQVEGIKEGMEQHMVARGLRFEFRDDSTATFAEDNKPEEVKYRLSPNADTIYTGPKKWIITKLTLDTLMIQENNEAQGVETEYPWTIDFTFLKETE